MSLSNNERSYQITENQIVEIIKKVVEETSLRAKAPQEAFMTPVQVAEMLSIDAQRVRRMCNSGELPAFRIGKYIRIDSKDLAEYLTRCDLCDPKKRRRGTW